MSISCLHLAGYATCSSQELYQVAENHLILLIALNICDKIYAQENEILLQIMHKLKNNLLIIIA